MATDLDHPTLGRLTFDPQLEWYSTQVLVGESNVSLHVNPGKRDRTGPGLKAAAGLVLTLGAILRDAKQYAAERLVSLKNDVWLDIDEPDVSLEGFVDRMDLRSVVVHEDGTATIYFDDGDLFWGHAILVERDRNGAFGDAYIAG